MDMGSLNGTLINFQAINHPDSGRRNGGDPFDIASGDVITLGTNSKILVSMQLLGCCMRYTSLVL